LKKYFKINSGLIFLDLKLSGSSVIMDGDDVTNSLIFGLIVVNRYVDDPNTALNGVSGVGVVDVGV
jgi:hypothetical protein